MFQLINGSVIFKTDKLRSSSINLGTIGDAGGAMKIDMNLLHKAE